MKVLCDDNGHIVGVGPICEFGYWEDEPDRQKWKIDDYLYAIDFGYTAYEVEDIPKDWHKYLYINGEFVKNPDYVEPPKTDAERIADLEAQLDAIANAIVEGVNDV